MKKIILIIGFMLIAGFAFAEDEPVQLAMWIKINDHWRNIGVKAYVAPGGGTHGASLILESGTADYLLQENNTDSLLTE
jgi:hypothetical protein